jgi:hypothetical protein
MQRTSTHTWLGGPTSRACRSRGLTRTAADIPVEQANVYDFLNRTARALGVVLPRSVLRQATRVIE